MDNRISVYASQYGRCAVTRKVLWIDEIHCHHKKPKHLGGTDDYFDLVPEGKAKDSLALSTQHLHELVAFMYDHSTNSS